MSQLKDCVLKDMVKKAKNQPTEHGEFFVNHISDKSKDFSKKICKWPITALKDVQHH